MFIISLIGYWFQNKLIKILTFKMDAKRFEEACTYILDKKKPLAPLGSSWGSLAPTKPSIIVTNQQSS